MKTTYMTALVFVVALGVASAACGVATEKYNGAVADLKKCQDDKAAANAQVADLKKKLGDVTGEYNKASARGSELEGNVAASQKELAELRKQHEEEQKRLAAFKAL